MKIEDLTWAMVETLVKKEKRAILPLGSVEQHGKLSLGTDMILARKVALEAAEPLGVPVYPVLAYGVAPYFAAYPGTVSLKMGTYLRLVEDILDSLYQSGHRQILIVNGHGGNAFAGGFAQEWLRTHDDARVRLHNWWAAPQTWERVQTVEKGSSHASWMENFPWTEVAGVAYEMQNSKPPLDLEILRQKGPQAVRAFVKDGNFGGMEKRDSALMEEIWEIAVKETRDILENGWAD